MATANSTDLIKQLDVLRANPSAAMRLTLKTLTHVTDGAVVVLDPTNPMVFALEMSIMMAAAGISRAETLTRRQYESLATSDAELYLHMADIDYLDRFSSPGRATLSLLFVLDEIKQKAVCVYPDNTGLCPVTSPRKLTIPRNSFFEVAGMRFTMQYPVDIWLMPHGGLDVRYDTDISTPAMKLDSNRPNWWVRRNGDVEYLRIDIPMQQLTVLVQNAPMNGVTGFTKSYAYSGNFYYARAFMRNAADTAWTEVITTHTDQIYDPNRVTVALKVQNNQLVVHVPQLYFNTGMVKDNIMIHIYTTQGEIDVLLGGYAPSAFSFKWVDHLEVTDNRFSAPLSSLRTAGVFCEGSATGGGNGVSFETLRDRVTARALSTPDIPITAHQLANTINELGYSLVTNLDNITDRQFLASRGFPAPANGATVGGAGCAINTLQARISDIVANDNVMDNGQRITIKAGTVFRQVNGILELVPNSLLDTLQDPNQTTVTELATAVNNGDFYFTPFYYVYDTSGNTFSVRPYRLDHPVVVTRNLVQDNNTLLVSASTKLHAIDNNLTNDGYILAIEVQGSESWNSLDPTQRHVQLSFLNNGNGSRVVISGERQAAADREIYYFRIGTNYDVDEQHNLIAIPSLAGMPLVTDFDLVYIVKDQLPPGAAISDIDNLVDTGILPPGGIYRGVSHETIQVKFGDYLENLWCRSRTVVTELEYQKYPTDVQAFYTETQYLRDSVGNIVLTYNSGTSEFEFTITANIGDPVMEGGQPVYTHRAGDTVLDSNGLPIPVGGSRGIYRQADLFMIDGRYFFATSESAVNYRREMVDLVTQWVVDDIEGISKRLLERTEIFFYPKTTTGTLTVKVDNGLTHTISASQSFTVKLHVSRERYENEALKASMILTSKKTLAASLAVTTIAHSDLVSKLTAVLGTDVLACEVYSNVFAPDIYPIVTIQDQSMLPSIGKQLVVLNNLTLDVQDAVNVVFIPHY